MIWEIEIDLFFIIQVYMCCWSKDYTMRKKNRQTQNLLTCAIKFTGQFFESWSRISDIWVSFSWNISFGSNPTESMNRKHKMQKDRGFISYFRRTGEMRYFVSYFCDLLLNLNLFHFTLIFSYQKWA